MNKFKSRNRRLFLVISSFLLFAILVIFSSTRPDGLERVLQTFHFEKEDGSGGLAPFSDYTIHPDFYPRFNHFLSALLGVGIIWIMLYFFKKLISAQTKRKHLDDAT